MTRPIPALELRDLHVSYRGAAGVEDISLTVASGEIHALIGLNGAGKSTLMRAALGMVAHRSGEVLIGGRADRSDIDFRHVGHLVGPPFAFPELRVETALSVAATLAGHDQAAVEGVLHELDLSALRRRRIRALSSGNRQRVGLAIALMGAPQLIVLDEPTNALDPAAIIRLRSSIIRRAGDGAGALVSSHHLDEVARIAHRITVIHRGRIVGSLDPGAEELERAFFAMVARSDGVT